MVSIVIPHWKSDLLEDCVKSLKGYDELILVVNDGIGFAKAVNKGLKLAKGDHIMVVNDDIRWVQGDLKDLCVDCVTSPKVNAVSQDFWGSFFCIPRKVLEQVGYLDEQFEMGYFEDDDYIMRLKEAGIEMKCVESCDIETKGGDTMESLPNRDEVFERNKKKFEEKWT